jgi:hypothetical protein
VATPTLSDAAAVTFTLPDRAAPAAGEVIAMVGGVVSAAAGVENVWSLLVAVVLPAAESTR